MTQDSTTQLVPKTGNHAAIKGRAEVAYVSPRGLKVVHTPWARSKFMIRFPKSAGLLAGRRFYSDLSAAKTAISNFENGKAAVSLGKKALMGYESAYRMLDDATKDVSVEEAVRFYLEHRGTNPDLTWGKMATAFRDYLKGMSRRYREKAEGGLKRAEEHIPADTLVATLTRQKLISVVTKSEGYWTQRAVAGAITAAYSVATQAGLLNSNPELLKDWKPKDDRAVKAVCILRHAEVHDLLMWVRDNFPDYLPAFALQFFLGIRTEELCRPEGMEGKQPRRSLYWSDLSWGKHVNITPEVGKGCEPRLIRFWPAALTYWLGVKAHTDATPVMPYTTYGNIKARLIEKFQAARRKAELPEIGWGQNVMRHTCASHWLALKERARFEISEGLGNSEGVLKKHYRNVEVTEEEATALFNLKPADYAENVIALSA